MKVTGGSNLEKNNLGLLDHDSNLSWNQLTQEIVHDDLEIIFENVQSLNYTDFKRKSIPQA